jgi:hypothetical protein
VVIADCPLCGIQITAISRKVAAGEMFSHFLREHDDYGYLMWDEALEIVDGTWVDRREQKLLPT